MKATIGLELFGDNNRQRLEAERRMINELSPGLGDQVIGQDPDSIWIAEIIGYNDRSEYQRRYLRGRRDYTKANSKGSRGVFMWYILEAGKTYEVSSRASWSRMDRYFCIVSPEGDIIRISKEEGDAWLSLLHGSENWA